jgi:hypothetical protein
VKYCDLVNHFVIAVGKQKRHNPEHVRTFSVLICSLALASLALGAPEEKKNEQPKKKGTQAGQVSQPGGKPTGAGNQTGVAKSGQVSEKKKGVTSQVTQEQSHVEHGLKNVYHSIFAKPTGGGKTAETGKAAAAGTETSASNAASSPHGYIGRNDGRVQQSKGGNKTSAKVSPTPRPR